MRPWKHTLTRTFADLSGSADNSSHDVSCRADGDESGKTAGMLGSKDGFEEQSSSEFARLANLSSGNGGEIGNVGENVEDKNNCEGNWRNELERMERVLRVRSVVRDISPVLRKLTLISATTLKALA